MVREDLLALALLVGPYPSLVFRAAQPGLGTVAGACADAAVARKVSAYYRSQSRLQK